ncbi:hypothetical protein FGG79_03835 [Bacillus sp. BHET2]|uniref:hypothetical protein n=1 Tax=Bacillus sp. BHET2 TaxID=2583818 RepID=UPI00110D9808|nr:hypothetical protein [Bacillus sp. BHET2]TMU87269.1 hypothetical protein FGG79_03835 [Bacillus sp. BHET2]
MRKKLSVISFLLFLIGAAAFIAMLLGYDRFLFAGVIISVAGFVTALFSEKGLYKRVGLFGNGGIVFVAIIVPLVVTTFFWNTP